MFASVFCVTDFATLFMDIRLWENRNNNVDLGKYLSKGTPIMLTCSCCDVPLELNACSMITVINGILVSQIALSFSNIPRSIFSF